MIDLLSNEVWSEEDITARTEAMVRSVVSDQEQAILMRKVVAASIGQWVLTDTERELQTQFSAACEDAHAAGVQARIDNDLLRRTIEYEAAMQMGEVVAEPDQQVLDLVQQRQNALNVAIESTDDQ